MYTYMFIPANRLLKPGLVMLEGERFGQHDQANTMKRCSPRRPASAAVIPDDDIMRPCSIPGQAEQQERV
jgi:hypothetical protein